MVRKRVNSRIILGYSLLFAFTLIGFIGLIFWGIYNQVLKGIYNELKLTYTFYLPIVTFLLILIFSFTRYICHDQDVFNHIRDLKEKQMKNKK